jgi:hypothetical protein
MWVERRAWKQEPRERLMEEYGLLWVCLRATMASRTCLFTGLAKRGGCEVREDPRVSVLHLLSEWEKIEHAISYQYTICSRNPLSPRASRPPFILIRLTSPDIWAS